MKLVILGSPGVGKGTYTAEIMKKLQVPHISSGDLFRAMAKEETPLGIELRDKYWSLGALVPDEITIRIVKERLAKDDCENGYILDGFPRTIFQAEKMPEFAPVDVVLNVKADPEVIIERLSGRIVCRKCARIFHRKNLPPKQEGICDDCNGELYQRDDDKPEAIKARLILYEQQTAPLISYYKERGILKEVTVNEDFGQHKEEILSRLFTAIGTN